MPPIDTILSFILGYIIVGAIGVEIIGVRNIERSDDIDDIKIEMIKRNQNILYVLLILTFPYALYIHISQKLLIAKILFILKLADDKSKFPFKRRILKWLGVSKNKDNES